MLCITVCGKIGGKLLLLPRKEQNKDVIGQEDRFVRTGRNV